MKQKISIAVQLSILGLLLTVLIFPSLFVEPPAPPPPPLTFDLYPCPDLPDGDVVIRLTSGVAFQIPPTAVLPRDVKNGEPKAGDPQLGCPGNPLVASAFAFLIGYDALRRDKARKAPANYRIELLQIFGHDGPLGIQRSNLKTYDRNAMNVLNGKDGYGCEQRPSGLSFCSNRTIEADTPRGPGVYRAPPGTYHEYDGMPFLVHCSVRHLRYPESRKCEADYRLIPGVTVSYRMYSDKVLPDQFLDLDREVRQQLMAARAPEYDAKLDLETDSGVP